MPFSEALLFLIFATLTGATLLFLLRPLRHAQDQDVRGTGESEIALYRDQLGEISRDVERGLISENEAEAARIEVSRRLLAADEVRKAENETAGVSGVSDGRMRRGIALLMVVIVPLVALGAYLYEGAPGMPGQPVENRLSVSPEELPLDGLVARIERHLKQNPDDAKGWEIIAPAYMELGRYGDAANAWTRAMLAGGVIADRLVARGEARMILNDGVADNDARTDFEKAIELDPSNVRGQYLLGQADYDSGAREIALTRWKKLLETAPDDAPWAAGLSARIATLEDGPAVSDEDAPMIRAMVDGLAARLEENPDDIEGWQRLIHSYRVLKENEKADEAVARAREVFSEQPEMLEKLK